MGKNNPLFWVLLPVLVAALLAFSSAGAFADSCSDTDGGKDYAVTGTVSYSYSSGGGGSGTDYCASDTGLMELYCESFD